MKIFDPKLTGSIEFQNPVQGNIEITGDLVVPGSITAREFKTEFVSASIIYQSGSTQFGDTVDDVHEFTGTVAGTTFNVSSSNQVISVDSGNLRVWQRAAGKIDFLTDDQIQASIDANGLFGIGTNTPQVRLDVDNLISGDIAKFEGSGSVHLTIEESGSNMYLDANNGNAVLGFKTNDVERMRINSAGSVGIGTSNPDSPLHVDTSGQLIARFASSNTGISGIRLQGVDTSAADTVYVDWFYDPENRKYGFGEGSNSGQLPLNSGLSQADIVVSNGNVGIGTDDPTDPLTVVKNSSVYNYLQTIARFGNYSGGAYEHGISLSSYGDALAGVIGSNVRWDNNTISKETTTRSSGWLQIVNEASGGSSLTFATAPQGTTTADVRMYLKGDGNLGVGTTNPAARLHVSDPNGGANGTSSIVAQFANLAVGATSGYLYIGAYSGTDWKIGKNVLGTASRVNFDITTHTNDIALSIDNSRRVGIATDTPSYPLDVNGVARSAGTTTDGNGRQYNWRINNTGNSGTIWRRIARFTADQSSRIKIVLTGQSGYSNDGSYGGLTTIIAQYNNANNLQGNFWREGLNGASAVYGVNFEYIGSNDYYINVQIGSYSEYSISADISDGYLVVEDSTVTGISANVTEQKKIISTAVFSDSGVAIGGTNYAPGGDNRLTVTGNTVQLSRAGGQFAGGYTNVYDLSAITPTYVGGVVKAYALENSNNNVSYAEYLILKSAGGWSVQLRDRITAGNAHGHISLQISGNYLQMKNDLNSSIGYGYVTLDLMMP